MPYLVDGNNLAHALGLSEGGIADRGACARTVGAFCRSQGAQAILVFDGPRPEGPLAASLPPRVTVTFGEGRSADQLILEKVARSKNPRDMIVVTSDKSLGDRARHLGAGLMKSHEFAKRLDRTPRSPSGPRGKATPRETPAQIEAWLRIFDANRR